MKTLAAILFTFFSLTCFSQDTIRSIELDSLIWNKINEYRLTKNVKIFNVFEDSLMRNYANKVADRNIKIFPTRHKTISYR